jgi:hypothetical protein
MPVVVVTGGFMAHFFADRGLIVDFAQAAILGQ